jgi:chromosome segregation ATPase
MSDPEDDLARAIQEAEDAASYERLTNALYDAVFALENKVSQIKGEPTITDQVACLEARIETLEASLPQLDAAMTRLLDKITEVAASVADLDSNLKYRDYKELWPDD